MRPQDLPRARWIELDFYVCSPRRRGYRKPRTVLAVKMRILGERYRALIMLPEPEGCEK